MNRRDTIIIAVLLNAGVLAILFMLAVNEREDDKVFAPPPPLARQEQPKQETQPIAMAKPSQEEFSDFNLDDTTNTSDEESSLPLEQYVFTNDIPIPEPTKPFQPPKPTTPPIPSEPTVEIIVKRGDSLDKLARNNGTTIEAIKKANNLKSDMLNVGQSLRIPTGGKAVTAHKVPEQKKVVADASGAIYYTIKSGDSPWKIAKQNDMNLDELLKLNNLNEEKARNLKIGDKIRIR